MGQIYDIEDIERWDERIREKAEMLGLSWFPQDFEICDHHGMLAYIAYSGMPSRYLHWSYGKAYEKLKAEMLGLSWFPQDFEICDHHGMLAYIAYSGMPSRYPHWSYGKAYEKLKTLYDHGVSGIPYEMVINSNPSLAYLMKDNSLLLQILTIAHVYAHNDFFKNNFAFRGT